jgi:hypothetical protein
MGWLDKLLGREKSGAERGSGMGGGREGARVTEPSRTSDEGPAPSAPAGADREGGGSERGPSERM